MTNDTSIMRLLTYENATFWLDNQCVLFLNSTLDHGNYASFKGFPMGTIPVAYIFPRNIYIFLSRLISLKIDLRCSLLSTWPCLAMQISCYIVNFIIIIILNLCFSFMSGTGCNVLNISLSSPPRTIFI